jgi:MoaA/NifB/PqqE/SkfB family radical SAM enzyme
MEQIPDPLPEESPEPARRYRALLDASIADALKQALRIIAADPALVVTGTRILAWQKKAAALRRAREEEGILVPPALFVSVTSQCNLACRGCYMRGTHTGPARELDPGRLSSLVSEASGLGVSIIVLAGGEPLIRKTEITGLARSNPRILFPVFSNGLLIDDAAAEELAGTKNIIPMISFEGFRNETDARRGTGVYDRLLLVCARLKRNGIFFGCSVTVTRTNADLVTSDRFVREMLDAGVRVFVFVEYVPIEPGTEALALDDGRRTALYSSIAALNKKYPALIIGFPGDEDAYGGCLAAGRGFLHVSASGDIEACPAAPFSDTNLARVSLREALGSPLLSRIRSHHHLLTETNGGCALWTNRAWVEGLLDEEQKCDE